MKEQINVLKQTNLFGLQFQIYGTAQEPLFLAKDVAEFIQNKQVTQMVEVVDEDEKLMCTINTSGQNRQMWFLTEDGLYEVLMQSRKPIAKQFKKGVKAILKEIRTNGGYLATHQEDTPEMIMARALQVAQATIEKHQQRLEHANETIKLQSAELEKAAPKLKLCDEIYQVDRTYTSTQMAKELNIRSANVLHKKLNEMGIMFKQSNQWLLTAKYSEHGYTTTRTATYNKADNEPGVAISTVWTEKGRIFLHNLFKQVS